MRRRPGPSARMWIRLAKLASGPAEGPAVFRRPLPGLLVDAAGLENQRAFAADRLPPAGSEHDAGADAYSGATTTANPEADRRASAGADAFGRPGIDVAAVGELGAACGRSPAQHHLVVGGSVPASRSFADPARGGTAGKQSDQQGCDSHRVPQGNENAPKISPRGVVDRKSTRLN